jgi:tetratricopeptide (TPR) repeat protein
MQRLSRLVTLAIFVLAGSSALADGKANYLTTQQMMARTGASGVKYNVGTETLGADPANVFWPERGRWPTSAVVVATDNGGFRVESRPCATDVIKELDTVEPAFKEKRYAEAMMVYRRVTTQHPECEQAWVFLGDALTNTHADAEALAAYDRAAALRPDEPGPQFFRGQVLLRLNRRDEAIASFVKALVLRPHYPALTIFLAASAPKLGLTFENGFAPRVLVRGTPPVIDVSIEKSLPQPDGVAWMSYAICKAFWIGDATHRREVTGSELHKFTMDEERECLSNLVAMSIAKNASDASLVRLRKITVEAKLLDAFIIYEIASRISPIIVLTLPPVARAQISRYVEEFVLFDAHAASVTP